MTFWLVSKVHFNKEPAFKIEFTNWKYSSVDFLCSVLEHGAWSVLITWTGTSNFVTWDVPISLELSSVESSVVKVRLKFWTMSSSQTSDLTQDPEESTGAVSVPDMSNTESNELAAIPKVKHAPFQSQATLRGEITEEQLKDSGEIFRKEQAKKYFSLRVRAF